MKRFGKKIKKEMLSNENIEKAIEQVNKGHRWLPNHKPNKTVLWIDVTKPDRVKQLRQIILNGFQPIEPTVSIRYDKNARKYREIAQPRLWPDQYIHHILIQPLQSFFIRRMDFHCCGSVPGRGAYYGYWHIKKWLREDQKGTKWCLEADIHHFYKNLKPEVVLNQMKKLIKDWLVLDLMQRCLKYGVLIGAYFSQWFANVILTPLDRLLRQTNISHYIRYIDNFTIFAKDKEILRKVLNILRKWLNNHSLKLKNNWQYFETSKRLPNALGYRYHKDYILIRKLRYLNIKKQIRSYYRQKGNVSKKFAQGMISRFGGLKHCNSQHIYQKIPNGLQRKLKIIIKRETQKELEEWNTFLEQYMKMAQNIETLKPEIRCLQT